MISATTRYFLTFLGGWRAEVSLVAAGGIEPIAAYPRLKTHRAEALLAYLCLYRGANGRRIHTREELIDRFWPEMDLTAARNNLSAALSAIRALEATTADGAPLLIADRTTVALTPSPVVECDVEAFDRCLREAARTPDATKRRALLEQAEALYAGPLLPNLYDDWALAERERLAAEHVNALCALAKTCLELGEPESARRAAERALADDPDSPTATRVLDQARTAVARGSALPSATPAGASALRRAPLPLFLTPLWGRDAEVAHLAGFLTQPDGPRLITILGPGGIGKTRLAAAAAAHAASDSRRAFWIPLADIADVRDILPVLLRTLKLTPNGKGDEAAWEAISHTLAPTAPVKANGTAEGRAILVLDNLEQLVASLETTGDSERRGEISLPLHEIVRELLARVPGLVVLTTSRRPLNVNGEQEFPLAPLTDDAAAALFVERAGRVRPGFSERTFAHAVAEIVRRVEGIPLALEMIAAWSRTMTPVEIVANLTSHRATSAEPSTDSPANRDSRVLDFLIHPSRDVPTRHRSVRETLDWSLRLLSSETRRIFAALGVFHGGWTAEAAEAVAGAGARDALWELAEHSLILPVPAADGEPGTRFRFLEPVREMAVDRLARSGDDAETYRRHAGYFAGFAASTVKAINSPAHADAQARYQPDEQNCRSAVAWLMAQAAIAPDDRTAHERMAQAANDFAESQIETGAQREGWEIAQRALALLPKELPLWRARLFRQALGSAWRLQLIDEIPGLLTAGEAEARAAGDRQLTSRFQAASANVISYYGRHAEAIALTEKTMADFPDVFAPGTTDRAWILTNLSLFVSHTHDSDRTIALLHQTVEAGEAAGEYGCVHVAMANLAFSQIERGDIGAAQVTANEALRLALRYAQADQIIEQVFTAAALAAHIGDTFRAVRLTAASLALAEAESLRRGVPLSEGHRIENVPFPRADWRAALSHEAQNRAEAEGRRMTLDDAAGDAFFSGSAL